MEKQNATIAIYFGERDRELFSLRSNRSTRQNPMAAHRKPFMVCSMVSHPR